MGASVAKDEPICGTYEPAGEFVHDTAPCKYDNWPEGHCCALVAPWYATKLPAGA